MPLLSDKRLLPEQIVIMRETIEIRSADMVLFAAVVRTGSFTRAAEATGLTKQAVSTRIARLERALQVRLLERTTRRLRPTDAGASYYERCQSIATAIAEANAAVQQRQIEPVGSLRIASPTLYGRRFLAPVLARYLEQSPHVSVECTLLDRRVDLIADGFDVAIQIGLLPDSSFRARRLGDGHLYFVASPAYVRTHGMPSVDTLGRTRCLGFRATEQWRIDDTRVRIDPVVTVNDLESLADLAIAGVGIARLPGLVCRDAVLDGRLMRLFPESRVPVRPVSVVYPSRTFLDTKVERFLHLLQTMVSPMAPLAAPETR
jgi:DNA-binding transcriptional LysR family regulator